MRWPWDIWTEKRAKRKEEKKKESLQEETFYGILEAFDNDPPTEIYIRCSYKSWRWLVGHKSVISDRPHYGRFPKIILPWFVAYGVHEDIPYLTFRVGPWPKPGQQAVRAKFPDHFILSGPSTDYQDIEYKQKELIEDKKKLDRLILKELGISPPPPFFEIMKMLDKAKDE